MAERDASTAEDRVRQARRRKAERLFRKGLPQAEIARRVGVTRQCVHHWYWQWRQGDGTFDWSRRRRPVGRKAKLATEQVARLEEALRQGPEAFGYRGERWTLWRVARVVERLTGVRLHPSSVWRLLRSLGWKLRQPPRSPHENRAYVAREWTAPRPKPRPS